MRVFSDFKISGLVYSILALACAGCGSPHSHDPGFPAEGTFRAVSYNVWGLPQPLMTDPTRFMNLVQEIPNLHADVIAFQETFDNLTHVLATTSAYPYTAWGDAGDFPTKISSGLLIVSKWPIVATEHIRYSACSGTDCRAAKGALWVRLDLGKDGMVDVFDTHLNADDATDVRAIQMDELKSFIASKRGDGPTLLFGDLNIEVKQTEYQSAIEFLGARDLYALKTGRSVAQESSGNDLFTYDPTRNSNISTDTTRMRLDYALSLDSSYSHLEVSAYQLVFDQPVLGRCLSDHFGILVDVDLSVKTR